eukprot:Platyproteum_vivax@DN6188_c0_g1_i1.p1
MGSPDPFQRQLNGCGGGSSSLSKIVIVEKKGVGTGALTYVVGQVDVNTKEIDLTANCGNMSSVVGPFALDTLLFSHAEILSMLTRDQNRPLSGPPPCMTSRYKQLITIPYQHYETKQNMSATFPVCMPHFAPFTDTSLDRKLQTPGASGDGIPVWLHFDEPASCKGCLLPSGAAKDYLKCLPQFPVTCMDCVIPVIYVLAEALGIHGKEKPMELEGVLDKRLLERIRQEGSEKMGLVGPAPLSCPKIAIISGAKGVAELLDGSHLRDEACDLHVRVFSVNKFHNAIPATVAINATVAAALKGTIVNDSLNRKEIAILPYEGFSVSIGCPSGSVEPLVCLKNKTAMATASATQAQHKAVYIHPNLNFSFGRRRFLPKVMSANQECEEGKASGRQAASLVARLRSRKVPPTADRIGLTADSPALFHKRRLYKEKKRKLRRGGVMVRVGFSKEEVEEWRRPYTDDTHANEKFVAWGALMRTCRVLMKGSVEVSASDLEVKKSADINAALIL